MSLAKDNAIATSERAAGSGAAEARVAQLVARARRALQARYKLAVADASVPQAEFARCVYPVELSEKQWARETHRAVLQKLYLLNFPELPKFVRTYEAVVRRGCRRCSYAAARLGAQALCINADSLLLNAEAASLPNALQAFLADLAAALQDCAQHLFTPADGTKLPCLVMSTVSQSQVVRNYFVRAVFEAASAAVHAVYRECFSSVHIVGRSTLLLQHFQLRRYLAESAGNASTALRVQFVKTAQFERAYRVNARGAAAQHSPASERCSCRVVSAETRPANLYKILSAAIPYLL